ncbi:MAG: outer membrane protein assembly factor BamB family protein [Phycisphaerales bacterium]
MHENTERFARLTIASLLLAAAGLLAGCAASNDAGDGPAGGGGGASAPAASGAGAPSADIEPAPLRGMREIGYRLDWKGYAILQRGATLQTLKPLGDVLVAQDSRNVITVMDPDTGSIRWADAVPNELDTYRGHFLRDQTLVSVTQSDITMRDIRNGSLVDRQRLSVLANTDAVFVDPIVVYGSTIGEAVGHNLVTGFKLWGNRLDDTIRVAPAVSDDGSVVVVSNSGEVLILDPVSGQARSRRNRVFEGVDSRPVADGQRAYIASRDRSLWAFSLIDGTQAWRYRTEYPLTSQPRVWDGSVYMTVPGEGFVAINSATGSRRWGTEAVSGELVGVRSGRLLVWDASSATLASVLASNGSVVEKHTFENPRFLSVEGFEDPNLYVVYPGGGIERYIPR